MSADGYRSYEELIVELRRLCAARRTGTLFIATADNEGGQVGLRDGLVVTTRFRRKTGLEAARALRKVVRLRFMFTRDFLELPDPTLSSSAVLAVLGDTEMPVRSLTPAQPGATMPPLGPALPPAPAQPVGSPTSSQTPGFEAPPEEARAPAYAHADKHEAIRAALTAALTEYLGPMAAVVVRDQLLEAARTGRGAGDVVDVLALAIDDPAAAKAFTEQARAALARL
jgi:hypothetical protein